MTGLESTNKQRFTIAKEDEVEIKSGLLAVPLGQRKEIVEKFDQEIRLDLAREYEKIRQGQEYTGEQAHLAEYLANASLLFHEGEFDLALEFYRSVLKIDEDNQLALKGLADCYSAKGQHEEAIKALQFLTIRSQAASNYKQLGDELYLMEYFDDAIQAYHQALHLNLCGNEELFSVYKNMGNAHLRLGDDTGAEAFYSKAQEIHPESEILMVNMASLFVYRGDFESALAKFRQAVQVNDKCDKAWVGLAMIHREYGDLDLAWANVEKALDINPCNPSAIRLVCEWAMKDNEIERGINRLSRYLESETDDAQVLMWYAKFLYFDGRIDGALATIERALQLNPEIEDGREVLRVIKEEILFREAKLK